MIKRLSPIRGFLKSTPITATLSTCSQSLSETTRTFDKAVSAWKRFLVLEGRAESSRAVARAYRNSGYKGVLKIMIDLQKNPSDKDLYFPVVVAQEYAVLGDTEDAIRWVAK